MADYDINLLIKTKGDAKGAKDVANGLKEVSKEAKNVEQGTDKAEKSLENLLKRSKLSLFEDKLSAQKSKVAEMVGSDKFNEGAVANAVLQYQKLDDMVERLRADSEKKPGNYTAEQAKGFAEASSKIDVLQKKYDLLAKKHAQLVNENAPEEKRLATWAKMVSVLGQINREEARITKEVEKREAARARELERASQTEQVLESAGSSADKLVQHTDTEQTETPLDTSFDEGKMARMNLQSALLLRLGDAFEYAGKAASIAVMGVSKFASSIGNAVKSKVDKFVGGLNNIVSSFKRIAFYRFIRSVIRSITEGFREGVNNLYQWSKALNGEFAQSMDKIATASLYMKNSLGAMVAPLLNALAPAIDYIIDRFVDLLNVINQVFAVLTGAGYWTKAIKYPHEYAKAAKGAGDATKKLGLAGIDQLTILDKNKGSTGSGFTAEDYAGMFQKQALGSIWESVKEAIESGEWLYAGKLLADKLNEIIDSFDAHAWGLKLGKKINNGIQFAYGFLKNLDFTNIGKKLAEGFNGLIEGINFDTLGRLLVRKQTAFFDTLIGFFQNLNWAQLGKSINDFLTGAINEALQWARDIDWGKLARDLWNGLTSMVSQIDYDDIARKLFELFGIALGATVSLLSTAVLGIVNSIKDYFMQYIEDENGDGHFGADEIISGICEGIVNALVGIGTWIKENIFDPFMKGIKEAFGIASPAKEMMPIGENVIEGFKEGITKKWTEFVNGFKRKWEDFKNWWRGLSLPEFKIKTPHLSWTTQPASGWVANILSLLGMPTSVPKLNVSWYAKGGFPDAGDLFIANESGAEMVGSMNGRTTVANNEQIVEGIRQGVYDAVTSAMASGSFNANVYLDGKQISGTVVQNINSETRRTGSSPLLSY